MNSILHFLKSDLRSIPVDQEKFDFSKDDLDRVREVFKNTEHINAISKHLKLLPAIGKNQIWTVKNEYTDFEGVVQYTSHPFLVLINNELDEIEGEPFVRVYVISPFVELASSSDEVCQNPSIIGFPFLIESWNDQPILTEILNEYIGYYEPSLSPFLNKDTLEKDFYSDYSEATSEEISSFHQEFMEIEISRSKYLCHSINSLLTFLENQQSLDSGVVISFLNKAEYPEFFIGENQKESSFSLAAKSGFTKEDKFLAYKNDALPFEMFFRRDEAGFILTIQPLQSLTLHGPDGKEIEGISNREKIVFAKLKKGFYTLISKTIKEPLKFRLK
jgi:hypothetical protein